MASAGLLGGTAEVVTKTALNGLGRIGEKIIVKGIGIGGTVFRESIQIGERIFYSTAKLGIKGQEAIKDFADSFKRFVGNEIGAIGNIDEISETAVELGRKADFLLGKATGTAHNVERSQSMLRQFEKIGLADNPETRAIIKDSLVKAFKDPSSITQKLEGGRILRESLISGPVGHMKVESIWEGNKLITAILKSGGQ